MVEELQNNYFPWICLLFVRSRLTPLSLYSVQYAMNESHQVINHGKYAQKAYIHLHIIFCCYSSITCPPHDFCSRTASSILHPASSFSSSFLHDDADACIMLCCCLLLPAAALATCNCACLLLNVPVPSLSSRSCHVLYTSCFMYHIQYSTTCT